MNQTLLRRKSNRAVTDSEAIVRYDPIEKPGLSNLLVIHALCSGETVTALEERYGGQGYGAVKKGTIDAVVAVLEPIQARYKNY